MNGSTAGRYDKSGVGRARNRSDFTLHFSRIAGTNEAKFHKVLRGHGLDDRELADAGNTRGIAKNRYPRHIRRNLLQQLQPFPGETVFELRKAGNVCTWMGHAFDQTGTNRVDDLQANDRNGRGRPRYRGGDDAAFSYDHVRRQSDEFRDVSADQLRFGFGRPIIELNVGALDPSQILQRL